MKYSAPLLLSCTLIFTLSVILVCRERFRPVQKRQYFSPKMFFVLGTLIALPGMLYQALNTEQIFHIFRLVGKSSNFSFTLVWVSILILLSFIFSIFGFRVPWGRRLSPVFSLFSLRVKPSDRFRLAQLQRFSVVVFIIGLLLLYYRLVQVGGVGYLWANIHLRARLSAGTSYISAASNMFIVLGYVCYFYCVSVRKKRVGRFSLIAMFFVTLISQGMFGGRGPVMGVVVLTVLGYNFWVRRVNVFGWRSILIVFFMLALFIVLSAIRMPTVTIDDYLERPSYVLSEGVSQLSKILTQLGGFDEKVVIVSYFNEEKLWLGSGYYGLLTSMIPSTIYEHKPPVDDGVYVYNMMLGGHIVPNMSMSQYEWNSWPPGNWKGFMEFHVLGLLGLSFFSSVFAMALYYGLIKSSLDPMLLFLYYKAAAFGVFNFSLLGLVQTIILFVYAVLFIGVWKLTISVSKTFRMARAISL